MTVVDRLCVDMSKMRGMGDDLKTLRMALVLGVVVVVSGAALVSTLSLRPSHQSPGMSSSQGGACVVGGYGYGDSNGADFHEDWSIPCDHEVGDGI